MDAYNKPCSYRSYSSSFAWKSHSMVVLRKSPEGYRIQEGDLVVKVNGVNVPSPGCKSIVLQDSRANRFFMPRLMARWHTICQR